MNNHEYCKVSNHIVFMHCIFVQVHASVNMSPHVKSPIGVDTTNAIKSHLELNAPPSLALLLSLQKHLVETVCNAGAPINKVEAHRKDERYLLVVQGFHLIRPNPMVMRLASPLMVM